MLLCLGLGVFAWIAYQAAHLAQAPPQTHAHATVQLLPTSSNASASSLGQQQQPLSACQLQLQQRAQALLDACPGLPGFCPRPNSTPASASTHQAPYLKPEGPGNGQMAQQKAAVDRFIAGPGFQERLTQLQQLPDKQGILISAGKPHHVGNAAIILHALRKQYTCTLPIEIAYRGDKEIDPVTRQTLTQEFAPLQWLDLEQQQYPAHHFRGAMDRYEPKIYALYHSRFQKVLMLDADNLPVRDPGYLFDSPHALQHGAMLWLDLWSPIHSSTTFIGHNSVFTLLGINKEQYWEVLSAGQGWLHRAAESGQLVFDRVRHADVLEYLWWLTSFSSVLYKHVLGDKDTFGFSFAMARKLHEVYAVAVPPAAAFKQEDTHWRFHGMLQYDHLGQPTFFHRTFEKWNDVRKLPQFVDVVSGPLPNRFIVNYLGNKSVALSPDVPHHVLHPVRVNCPAPAVKFVVGAGHNSPADHTDGSSYAAAGTPCSGSTTRSCLLPVCWEYQQARELGLPVSRQPRLESACQSVTEQLQAGANEGVQVSTPTVAAAVASAPSAQSAVAPSRALGMRRRLQACESVLKAQPQEGLQHLAPGQQRKLQADLSVGAAGAGHGISSKRRGKQPQQEPGCAGRDGSVWGEVDAGVWLRACRAQRDEHMHRQQQGALAGDIVSPGNASQQLGLPGCDAVEWGVARYVLHEYAEAVAVGSDGKVLRDPDPRLSVLQLSAAAGIGEQQVGSTEQGPCGLLDGPVCAVDRLQLEVIPAARAWVLANVQHLPALVTQDG